MTIFSTTNIRTYAGPGNGFTYDKPVFSEDGSDLVVTTENPDGVLTVQTLSGAGDQDYTISGTYDPAKFRYPNGVTVTLNENLPAGWRIAIVNDPERIQESDYVNGGPLDAERLETDLDRQVILDQSLATLGERALRQPVTDPDALNPLPTATLRADRFLAFDNTGQPTPKTVQDLGGVVLSDSNPEDLGTAGPGTSSEVSRSDHVHKLPTSTDLGLGTAAEEDVGTDPGDVVQLDGSARLPAVDGSQLTNLPVAAGLGNRIINGDFRINQRGYASAAALSAGAYGHDRWKAGASGGDYSFTQLSSSTEITIASGKSLIQVIEAANVEGGTYVLSWEGTAEARAGVDSDTPSGSYAASPLVINGQTAGTVMSVEFNEGTLGKVQLEPGETVSDFEARPIGIEIALCQRYFRRFGYGMFGAYINFSAHFISSIVFQAPMRVAPTLSLNSTTAAGVRDDGSATSATGSSIVVSNINASGLRVTTSGWSGGHDTRTGVLLTSMFDANAEL